MAKPTSASVLCNRAPATAPAPTPTSIGIFLNQSVSNLSTVEELLTDIALKVGVGDMNSLGSGAGTLPSGLLAQADSVAYRLQSVIDRLVTISAAL